MRWATDGPLLITAGRRYVGRVYTASTGELMTLNVETSRAKKIG